MGAYPDPSPTGPQIGPKPPHKRDAVVHVWDDADRGGQGADVRNDDAPYVGDSFNDQISSIWVESGTWRFFEDRDYNGDSFTMGPNQYNADLKSIDWNDKISSIRLESY